MRDLHISLFRQISNETKWRPAGIAYGLRDHHPCSIRLDIYLPHHGLNADYFSTVNPIRSKAESRQTLLLRLW